MSGISASTVTDLLLALGAYVTIGGVDMGALSGTIRYWVETERVHPAIWGVRGDVKGFGYIRRAVPKIAFEFTEWEYLKFQEIWHSIGASSDANSEKIGGGDIGRLDLTDDYKAVEVLGFERHDGKDVKIVLDQAYISSNFDVALSDREDSFIAVELTGVYLATTPRTFPAALYIAAEPVISPAPLLDFSVAADSMYLGVF